MSSPIEVNGLTVRGTADSAYREILSEEALVFLAELVEKFGPVRDELLQNRVEKQATYDAGGLPDFLPETKSIREGDWKIAGIPDDLKDRRVEITGPTDRKMVINALNADVKVYMSDFEDSLSPTWENVVEGQINLRDANLGTIEYTNPGNGKHYALKKNDVVLIARTRGIHLPEKHITFGGKAIPGCLMDFALYFFHNYRTRMENNTGVYYYIPKLQSHLEARWWNEVFEYTEKRFGVEIGTIKATFLIETIPAVFEMDEILYELRDHVVALNCGRWDYIFSYIKTLRKHGDRVLPDRQAVTMDKPFLNAYSRLLIKTCHKRGAMAMGGMAAFIPSKNPEENEKVIQKVINDKQMEANNGHDGTWIAHPGLANVAMGVFDETIPADRSNQLHISRDEDAEITAAQLLEPSEGERTEEGMRLNIRIALQYIEAWIDGNGCVPIYGLMEDAATAEISRASIWQWIQNGKTLSNGKLVTAELFRELLNEELDNVRQEVGEERWQQGRFNRAAEIFDEITTSDDLVDFLTLPGYEELS